MKMLTYCKIYNSECPFFNIEDTSRICTASWGKYCEHKDKTSDKAECDKILATSMMAHRQHVIMQELAEIKRLLKQK